ncbi:MAG: YbaK/EbsC family protein [Anaerolineales bacterium]
MTECLDRLQHWLREQHVSYASQHHRPAFTNGEVALELQEQGEHVAKVVIANADHRLVMLVVPATEQVDFKRAAQQIAAGLVSAAQEKEFKSRFPDCELGAMPPFGSLYDMPTYMDESLTKPAKLVFQAGTHRDTIRLATEDYLRLARPIIVHLTQPQAAQAAREMAPLAA